MSDDSYWIAFGINVENSDADLHAYKQNDLHITLAYLGKGEEQTEPRFVEKTSEVISKLVRYFPGSFTTGGLWVDTWHDKYLVLNTLDISTKIKSMRQTLVDNLFIHNIWYSTKYDWNPHITLGKIDEYTPEVIKRDIAINGIFMQANGVRYHWEL